MSPRPKHPQPEKARSAYRENEGPVGAAELGLPYRDGFAGDQIRLKPVQQGGGAIDVPLIIPQVPDCDDVRTRSLSDRAFGFPRGLFGERTP